MRTAAVGLRVKSGRAIAVVVAGSAASVEVCLRTILALSDPRDPATQQPYHAGMGRLEEERRVLRARIALVRRAARASVRAMLRECRSSGAVIIGASLVVGSTIDPDTIGSPHIRAHALEGRLFRTVVEEALAAAGVVSRVIVARSAFSAAEPLLARSAEDVRRAVSVLGRGLDGPWRADEKLAALAAWMVLADPPAGRRTTAKTPA